jgi:hypothetical protein
VASRGSDEGAADSPVATDNERSMPTELEQRLLDELLRRGHAVESARNQVAPALERCGAARW